MVDVKIVPQKHWDILKEYLPAEGGVVLVSENVLAELPEDTRKAVQAMDGEEVDYNFGEMPDLYVEMVSHPGHYFMEQLLSQLQNRD